MVFDTVLINYYLMSAADFWGYWQQPKMSWKGLNSTGRGGGGCPGGGGWGWVGREADCRADGNRHHGNTNT